MEFMTMTEKIEIEIKPHIYEKIQHDLDERNKELAGDRKLNESQYMSLILERHYVEKEYVEVYNKLYALQGKLQGLENSINGKRAKSLFKIDEMLEKRSVI